MKFHQPQFTTNDVEIKNKDLIYQGHIHLYKYQLRFRLFAGGWSEIVSREVFQSFHAVGVLLFDPIRDEILLNEEFRIGPFIDNNNDSPWLLELVAGVIEHGESLEEVAYRETKEEAGCDILDLIPMLDYWSSPGISTAKFSLFCGRFDATHAGGIFGLAEEHEDIRAHVFPKETVFQAVRAGEIKNAATIIAIQWLMLNEAKVKAQWLR